MRYRSVVALALGLTATLAFSGQTVFGQFVPKSVYRTPGARTAARSGARMSPAAYAEQVQTEAMPVPPGQAPQQSDPFGDDSAAMQSFGPPAA